MEFGVCVVPATASIAAKAGYDFAEWAVGPMLMPESPEQEFEKVLAEVEAAELGFPVRSMIPGEIMIVGDEVDWQRVVNYVKVMCRRAKRAGVDVIVFGSGGARKIPDGFDRVKAWEQIVRFGKMSGEEAGEQGVLIVVEPLHKGETNVLNTVGEGAKLVEDVGLESFQLLVDAYHLMKDGDSYEDIVKYGPMLRHVHIATVTNRVTPGAEECDFTEFFGALKKGGYDGRVSIEARIKDLGKELPLAMELMRGLAGE